ncbi:head-tail connector protein [Roseovarius salis]|uniref:head-tail connector protein n=1 Tax=Roseovarius salis TaxID=3376063 RepID=UPI0037CC05F4
MMLIEETAVPQSALPIDAFKAHLRLGTGFSDGDVQDPVLESFLRAAISAIEGRTGKILIARAFSWIVSRWRDPAGQPLPVAPVSSVTRLVLRNREDEEEVIDPALYRLEEHMHRPVLRPRGEVLPVIPTGGTAELDFDAGLAPDWDGLPADLGQAVLLLAAHYHEYRHETALGGGCMPFGVTSLIERYRNVRIFAGGAS